MFAFAETLTPKTTLNELINETIDKNPDLLQIENKITAQTFKSKWIKSPPDPFVAHSSATSKAPFRYDTIGKGPMNQAEFVLGQKFPFPGKLKLKGKIEISETEKLKEDYSLTKLTLISRLKSAYYNLFFTVKSLQITEQIKILLEDIANSIKAKYEVGNGNQHDLLKAQLEISVLLQQIEILKKDRESFIAEINSIVVRPQGTDIRDMEEVSQTLLAYNADELINLSKENYPLLLAQKARIEKGEYGVKLAKKEYFPDFSIAGGYGLRTEPFDPMYTLQVGTTIPLYFKSKQRNQLQDAKASLEAEKEKYRSIIIEAEKNVKDLLIRLDKHSIILNLLGEGIIPQARMALESSIAAYKVDKADFLTLLDNVRALFNFQIDYYENLVSYEKQIAALEPLVGRQL